MDSERNVCPVCGQPVDTVVRRYKTLGAWVPKWVAGPCRNPQCDTHVVEGAEPEERPAQEQQHTVAPGD
ncbi:hypothetical protein ACFYWX_46505 [Streptomyces sp. NPDC002888]|uniref:hypothetical protein n=1 Tax=Streptomyces sp. NPDC002888 TaxID=3364668 RepID=UPI00369A4C92